MSTHKSKERAAGSAVQVVDPAQHPRVTEASRHLARQIHKERLAVLGLCPSSDEIAVLPACLQIANALAEQSDAPVALLDVNARWSALPAAAAGQPLITRWISGERVALLSLPPEISIGAGMLEIGRLLQSGRTMFEHILVDFTGLDRVGEHLSAASHCDALIFVAQAGVTTDIDLLRLSADFYNHRSLGVLLIGTR